MSNIALSHKAAKLMKLCDLEGYRRLYDLLKAYAATGACWRRCLPAFGRRRSRRGVLVALLQNFLGRIGINRHVILAGDGAFRHRGPGASWSGPHTGSTEYKRGSRD